MSWFDIIAFWGPTAVFCVLAFMVGLAFSGWLEHNHNKHWKEWKIKFPLKPLYIGIALVIFVPLVILFSNLLSDVAGIPTNTMITPDQVRTLAIAFVGTITGIGALFGVYLAILRSEENKRQNDTAEQGLITDRINKAVEGLGKINQKDNPIFEVRIGALYALERIAQDSLRDHIRIMKIICSYIYVREPLKNSTGKIKSVKEDIRAALIIIGQRGEWTEDQRHLKNEEEQGYYLDLRHCNLRNAGLNDANMSGAILVNTTLELGMLSRAKFNDANLGKANLTKATLTRTDFENAYMGGAFAYEGNFSNCLNLTQKQLNIMYCGKDVKIPKMDGEKEIVRPGHWPIDKKTREEFIKSYEKWRQETGH